MNPSRRVILKTGAGCTLAATAGLHRVLFPNRASSTPDFSSVAETRETPTFGSIPVIGDGKWIWTKPPKNSTGYLEPRYFDVTTEIKSTGRGPARNLVAATVLPSEFPEQTIVGDKNGKMAIHASGAMVQPLADGARQLLMSVNQVVDGQVNVVRSTVRLKVSKSYFGYKRDQFPADQPKQQRWLKSYLGSSPGIKVRSAAVSRVVNEIKSQHSHPWDQAQAFHKWVFKNIKGQPQAYTSVDRAIKNGVGDCEERAGVFIAFCRAAAIPARLVWIPSHCWAEILLFDTKEKPHWIPVHTAAYSWFGWTGVHEVVLQKGDTIAIPQQRKNVRLVYDHFQCQGKKPKLEFTAIVTPVAASSDQDAGPGRRHKLANGKWQLVGKHKADKFHRKD